MQVDKPVANSHNPCQTPTPPVLGVCVPDKALLLWTLSVHSQDSPLKSPTMLLTWYSGFTSSVLKYTCTCAKYNCTHASLLNTTTGGAGRMSDSAHFLARPPGRLSLQAHTLPNSAAKIAIIQAVRQAARTALPSQGSCCAYAGPLMPVIPSRSSCMLISWSLPAKSLSSVRNSMQWHSLRSRMGTHGQFQKPCCASASLSS